jgi:hypothetical protein
VTKNLILVFIGTVLSLSVHPPTLSAREGSAADSASNWYDSVSARFELSNISYQSLKDELKIDIEAEISNVNQGNYVYDLLLSYDYDEDEDPFDKSRVTDKETDAEFTFQVTDFFHDKFNYSSSLKYSEEQNNSDKTNVYDIDLAPLGVKWSILRGETIRKLSLDYLPTYNYHHYYYMEDENDYISSPGMVPKAEKAFQQTLKFIFDLAFFSGKIDINNKLVYKNQHPFSVIRDNEDDFQEVIINNRFRVQYNLNEYFSVGYKYEIDSDERRERTQHLPKVDQIHSATFTVSWN